ncbi:MAG: glycosyltransferase family 4 protein [Desulfobulbaceae bacterium]|nr:MAG: glycosyltransferase family 4 protein [Desulfobulbaceae bacterium]
MKIAMFTNTFSPHVGGVARSVQGLADELRRLDHHVLVVAPRFSDKDEDEKDVLRMPAVQNFNGSDFSLPVPAPVKVAHALRLFSPDIIHSHHPFLLGETALRVAVSCSAPVVFTHHTRYEQYTHYLPGGDSEPLKHFVIDLVNGYCNLCNMIVAPSNSIADILRAQKVKTPIEVIPTGIDPLFFAGQDRVSSRQRLGIPEDAFVVGHVGRLAPEKNLFFLMNFVVEYLLRNPAAHFLLVGEGPAKEQMLEILHHRDLMSRTHLQGVLDRSSLVDAYRTMDTFVFASQSETQGMVLAEAMAAGTPVVALDAPGVREIVNDGINGRLLMTEETGSFAAALAWLAGLSHERGVQLRQNACRSAEEYSQENCVRKMVGLYSTLVGRLPSLQELEENPWQRARKRIRKELEILGNYGHALEDTLQWLPMRRKSREPDIDR